VAGHVIGQDMFRREVASTRHLIEGKIKDFQGMSLGKKLRFLFKKK